MKQRGANGRDQSALRMMAIKWERMDDAVARTSISWPSPYLSPYRLSTTSNARHVRRNCSSQEPASQSSTNSYDAYEYDNVAQFDIAFISANRHSRSHRTNNDPHSRPIILSAPFFIRSSSVPLFGSVSAITILPFLPLLPSAAQSLRDSLSLRPFGPFTLSSSLSSA